MRLNVMYSTDENYSQHAIASIISLLENNKEFNEIFIYLVENNIKKATKEHIDKIIKAYDRDIVFISLQKICNSLETSDDFPISAYARLFVSEIDDIDKLLYLDCDTIINKSLLNLWETDISGYLVAGVQDNPAIYMLKLIGMNKKDRYLNSGVLLINLREWRLENIEQKFIEFIKIYRGMVPHHDQGVINGVCKNRILILHPKYNLMPEMVYLSEHKIKKLYNILNYYTDKELQDAYNDPYIIHYICKFYNRPWNKKCSHPKGYLYRFYLDKLNFEYVIKNEELKRGVVLRKYVFENMPFLVYCAFEKALNIKRKLYLRKIYNFIKIKI